MINTYSKFIPLWMKEDEQFTKVYKYIESIFNQVVKTCEDMRNDLIFNVSSAEFIKLLSIFGQSSTLKRTSGKLDYKLTYEAGDVWRINRDEGVELNISLSKFSLYYLAKFNALKNNFDGTFKNFEDSIDKIFNDHSNANDIENYLTVECKQSIVQDNNNLDHPAIEVTLVLGNSELLNYFPPYDNTAYTNPDPEDPSTDYIGDIRCINMDWVNESEENTTKYNNYKNLLELLILFDNSYFDLDILGVITKFDISDNARVLTWGEARWNQSLWSGTYVTAEEE